ncbi:MAG: UDP-N-acetylglucosamine 2-epimerase (non-hydrolyzing) [Candidatus Ancaeobacter aquaticus]|nr:UDP-N-acetylglucosamine 2-epimerase (non-hydrolyzing) [Candidatus Ancaeobacter aquaticus]
MKKVLVVFGTRPEAIKMAPIVLELKKHPRHIKTVVCVTAQHRHMLDQVLSIFKIKPDVDLNIMRKNQDLTTLTINTMKKIHGVLKTVKPDIVLVQGDTTTAMVVGLECFYQKIKIGHVEAGLRTFDRFHPFPEEVNRRILSSVADYHFAPSKQAVKYLLKEGIRKSTIYHTGNPSIDALLMTLKKNKKKKPVFNTKKKLILVTAHRRENFGKPFGNICKALMKIALRNDDVEIVYPVHLNPNVRKPVFSILSQSDRVHLIEPLEYDGFALMMSKAHIVLTDSGGVQEEAPSIGKPVLVMRKTTERPEVVKAGAAKLVGTSVKSIVDNVEKVLHDKKVYTRMSRSASPYGKGDASRKIVRALHIV